MELSSDPLLHRRGREHDSILFVESPHHADATHAGVRRLNLDDVVEPGIVAGNRRRPDAEWIDREFDEPKGHDLTDVVV